MLNGSNDINNNVVDENSISRKYVVELTFDNIYNCSNFRNYKIKLMKENKMFSSLKSRTHDKNKSVDEDFKTPKITH